MPPKHPSTVPLPVLDYMCSACIGRSIKLVLQNVGGAKLAGTESTTLGSPMKVRQRGIQQHCLSLAGATILAAAWSCNCFHQFKQFTVHVGDTAGMRDLGF